MGTAFESEIHPTEEEIEERNLKIPNGGRKVTVTGNSGEIENNELSSVTVVFDVISSYSPSWTKEYGDEFTTWDGRKIKPCKGIRFALEFTVYALTYEKLGDALKVFNSPEIQLECDEFAGEVICDSISPPLKVSNYYGNYYELSISLSSAALETSESGFL